MQRQLLFLLGALSALCLDSMFASGFPMSREVITAPVVASYVFVLIFDGGTVKVDAATGIDVGVVRAGANIGDVVVALGSFVWVADDLVLA